MADFIFTDSIHRAQQGARYVSDSQIKPYLDQELEQSRHNSQTEKARTSVTKQEGSGQTDADGRQGTAEHRRRKRKASKKKEVTPGKAKRFMGGDLLDIQA